MNDLLLHGELYFFSLSHERLLMGVTILCIVMSVVLFGFLVWHFWLVASGETSNEYSKWRGLKGYLKEVTTDEAKKYLAGLKNTHDKGVMNNLKEVFFPIDVHALGAQYEPTEEDLKEDAEWEEEKK